MSKRRLGFMIRLTSRIRCAPCHDKARMRSGYCTGCVLVFKVFDCIDCPRPHPETNDRRG